MKNLSLVLLTLPIGLAACALEPGAAPSADARGALPAGVRWIEAGGQAPEGQVGIPYEKLELENGLTVLLHADDSDPLVHVNVTYHVGASREQPGRSGFAHFFEHMMFQGSQHVGDDQHFELVTESGGTLNGSTGSDLTNYFQTVPSNQLERVLWLEADRMGFLLPAVTPEKFENQRETVKNERGQRVDNAPYGRVSERVNEALYPPGHPYSWPVIGYIEDLNRATLDDLRQFFLRWYGPNNATLTIGGDFDRAQTLAWIQKYFGPIPRGPEVADPEPAAVTLDADRYISFEDNVSLPMIRMTWPTVYRSHPDEAPLDVLASILGDGETSLLYKNLLKDGTAVNARAFHACGERACALHLYALPNPAQGASLADLDQTLRASLAEIERRGVLPDDLERVKTGIRAGAIYGLESVQGKIRRLAGFETIQGRPDYLQEDLARYAAVRATDVTRVYERYLKDRSAVVLSVVPNGQAKAVAAPDSFTPPERPIAQSAPDSELPLRIPQDAFDRSAMPAPGPNPELSLPPIWRASLANGAPVLGARSREVPTTTVRVRIEAGQRSEPPGAPGLASLTAALMDESTLDSTTEELSNRLQKLGSRISMSSDDRYATLSVRSLTENLSETLSIALEKLTRPAFDERDFARVKAQRIESIESAKKQPGTVANQAMLRLVYGPQTPEGQPDGGTSESIAGLSLDDVKAFYRSRFSAPAMSVVAVSDLPREDLLRELQVFGRLATSAASESPPEPARTAAGGVVYLIDKPDAAQSEIRVARPALPYDATGEYYRAQLLNYPLGGAFSSRINLNLREDKGYTYGARSGFRGGPERGHFAVSTGVRTDATASALSEIYAELDQAADSGLRESELAFTKSAVGQSEALRYESPGQKLGLLGTVLEYDLDDDFLVQRREILASLGKAELDALAARYLATEDMITVIVGDREVILPGLRELGRPIVPLDDSGTPLREGSGD